MSQPAISILVPVFNEEKTLQELIERLHLALTTNHISYEVIAIDDNSSDASFEILTNLSTRFPVKVYRKNDPKYKGKGFSLVNGFKVAQSDVIAMIDADLQYPPEAIPEMFAKLQAGTDMVIAERKVHNTSFVRRTTSWVYRTIFAQFLHGLEFDVQSGLKVFRKEIVDRVTLHPTPLTFDLELVVKAQHAGYSVASVPIVFSRRRTKSRVNVAKTSLEIGGSALKFKGKAAEAIPFTSQMTEKDGRGFHYRGQKFVTHNSLFSQETALFRLAHNQRFFMIGLLIVFIIWFAFNWHAALVGLVAILTLLYFADLLFNFFLIYSSFSRPPELVVTKAQIDAFPEKDWPKYTVFCPLYKEPEVIPQFVTAMGAMDYPKDKLQVMLLLEADDKATIQKAQSMTLPSNFEVVVVPHSLPKTKPKACNYGLTKATGEYCVIYDAEDVPDKDQIKKTVIAFRRVKPNVVCIQAKLNFYNPHQNILTRAFTAEYSLWFDLVLTGLQATNTPIPLGGTSNHFKIEKLKELKGWDSFNVTEDCDLGIRLSKRGYTTAVLDSTTLEEANSSLSNWFGQRSRWIKGYMQTYLVHMRKPSQFIKRWNDPHVITFQLVVGGKIMSMFINPLMWIITFSYFAFRPFAGEFIESFFPGPVLYMGVFSFVFGNFLYLYYYMIGCAKREHYDLIKYAYLVPFYWLAMSIAAWIALKELIIRPHHWSKTKHGLHIHNRKAMKQATEKVGRNLVHENYVATT